MKIDNQRMLDLLRVCRSELFVEHELISDEEYAWLASQPSRETHARLKDYDTLRAQLAAATEQVRTLTEERDAHWLRIERLMAGPAKGWLTPEQRAELLAKHAAERHVLAMAVAVEVMKKLGHVPMPGVLAALVAEVLS